MLKALERTIRHRLRKKKSDRDWYSPDFYAGQQQGSRNSANVVVPLVLEIVKPRRVIDVGCGVGTWAAEFMAHSLEVRGIDGDYVRREDLQIPTELFSAINLNSPPPAQEIGQFDLAVCLEVAEHLDASASENLLTFLTDLAPAVLFSAAIPGQGGRNHINEQWQSHWIERFAQLGFGCHDVIRPKIWTNPVVRPWYAQNIFLFAKGDLPEIKAACPTLPYDLVHPLTFERRRKR